jgi:predicted O-linked N-acetylglucosamine transferase (SPINDLY family)
LIDLDGNTANNSLAAFALRPAPIQMTYLGYPNTTGLKTIQYRITDSVADNISTKQMYSEELVRLPTCFLCYDSVYQKRTYPPNPTNPKQIILSALNKEPKNTLYILDIWRRVLAASPTTILLIRLDSFDNVEGRMEYYSIHHDVTKDRLILRTKMHDEEYNQIFTQVDILLDTAPYSGTTTTCNALLNSLPVVTLYNPDYHASNVSASILKHAGIDGLVAYSADEYVDIITTMIRDISILDRHKRSIREKFLNLMKPSRFMPPYEKMLLEKYEKGLADGFL